jgi:histidine triad (HIT) family protein
MTKENCIICNIVSGKVPSKKVYEDEDCLAVLDVNGANPGHSFIIPKEHHPILEKVPDQIVGKLFSIANKVSSAIFETLNIQGTNIFVSNGIAAGQKVAHFMINVIPRNENDKINLQWPPKQLSEEEMSTVELKLKEASQNIGYFEKKEPKKQPETKTATQEETIEGEENYLIKQLDRRPHY